MIGMRLPATIRLTIAVRSNLARRTELHPDEAHGRGLRPLAAMLHQSADFFAALLVAFRAVAA